MIDTQAPTDTRLSSHTEHSKTSLQGIDANLAPQPPVRGTTQLVCASRGDHLTRYLFGALAKRYPITGNLDANLYSWERYLVALASFHPSRTRWVEQFYKSSLAYRLRSRRSRIQLAKMQNSYDVVFQIHALFEITSAPTIIYIDCTHQQSAEQWPAWNPLKGKDLDRWYARERAAYHQAAHLFVYSQSAARSLIDFYGVPESQMSVVGAGLNFEHMPEVSAAPREPIILFIGNDFIRKGGDVLLEAFQKVRAHIPAARLQIVGTRYAIEPAPGVEVLGRIEDRNRIKQLYAEAAMFCMPSRYEPYGLSLLEAMAYGLPCVTTASCGIPEVVLDGETGVIVPPDDSDTLADAMLHLLRNPAYATMLGAAGHQRVEQHFTWDHIVDRMAPALDALGVQAHSTANRRV